MTEEIDDARHREIVCEHFRGRHYKDAEFMAASKKCEWDLHWPIVDGDGDLTGSIFESGDNDSDNYANVDGVVMVEISNLPADEQASIAADKEADCWDGYAKLAGDA